MSAKILPVKTFLTLVFRGTKYIEKAEKKQEKHPEYQGFNQPQFKDKQTWKQPL